MNWTEAHILGDIEAEELPSTPAERIVALMSRIEELTAKFDMAAEGWAEATRLIELARQQYGAEKSRAEALTEQLEAARADAKEAEAYAEELERDLNTCRMAQAVMDNTVAELVQERDEANDVIDKQGALLADAYGAYLDWDEVLKDRADHECKAKLAKVVELLKEARQDLEAYVTHDWPKDVHPHYDKKWERDMELCRRIDTTLAEIEGEKG
jgi:chromosome segregation ATPase